MTPNFAQFPAPIGGHSVTRRLWPKRRGVAHRLVLHASDVGGSAPRVVTPEAGPGARGRWLGRVQASALNVNEDAPKPC